MWATVCEGFRLGRLVAARKSLYRRKNEARWTFKEGETFFSTTYVYSGHPRTISIMVGILRFTSYD